MELSFVYYLTCIIGVVFCLLCTYLYNAGVDIHWCACHTQFKVKSDEVDRNKVSDLILTALNQLTSGHRETCIAYTEIKILDITRLVPNEEVRGTTSLYNEFVENQIN